METINKVEILGNVGFVKIQKAGERQVIHLSVATTRVARNKSGENLVETTWHNVEAWEGENIADFPKITKGAWVRVLGRLRTSKYTTSENVEKYSTEIVANLLEVVTRTE